MLANVALDGFVGAVPVVGDAFDVMWRANRRNVRLLREWLGSPRSRPSLVHVASISLLAATQTAGPHSADLAIVRLTMPCAALRAIVVACGGPFVAPLITAVVAAVIVHRHLVRAGQLISYGADELEMYQRAGTALRDFDPAHVRFGPIIGLTQCSKCEMLFDTSSALTGSDGGTASMRNRAD
jgi:uncharacterized protein DUF4112